MTSELVRAHAPGHMRHLQTGSVQFCTFCLNLLRSLQSFISFGSVFQSVAPVLEREFELYFLVLQCFLQRLPLLLKLYFTSLTLKRSHMKGGESLCTALYTSTKVEHFLDSSSVGSFTLMSNSSYVDSKSLNTNLSALYWTLSIFAVFVAPQKFQMREQ